MAQITFEVTRNGNVTKLEESVAGTTVGDLIKSLKVIKESSNETLTKLLQEENSKDARKAVDEKDDSDEEDGEKQESRKKLKS